MSEIVLTPYTYAGPPSGVTLDTGLEVLLFDGQSVELPAAHDYVQTLVALGRLKPVEKQPAKRAAKGGE